MGTDEMIELIGFTDENNRTFWLNPEKVVAVIADGKRQTHIIYGDGEDSFVVLNETIDDVLMKLTQ